MADQKKTFTVPQMRAALADPTFRPRLAKSLRDAISRNAAAIAEMQRLEKATPMQAAHFEPGKHEPSAAGVPQHLEPGADEQYVMNPPAQPEAQNPIGSGAGLPAGQMAQLDPCAYCQNQACMGTCSGLGKGEKNPGHNGDPSKRQPSPPVKGAKLAPDKVKASPAGGSGDLPAAKANPLGKADVPTAKPPSGKVPGQGKPPMSSSTSKPAIKGEDSAGTVVPAKCKRCGHNLGAQDPGDTCGHCKNLPPKLGKAGPVPSVPKPATAAPSVKPLVAPKPVGTPGGLGHRAAQGPLPAPLAPKSPPGAPSTKLPAPSAK